jgi:hypothetical protein
MKWADQGATFRPYLQINSYSSIKQKMVDAP